MSLKNDNLIELIGNIEGKTIEDILLIDNKEKLRKKIMEEKRRSHQMIKWVLACGCCLCMVLVGAYGMRKHDTVMSREQIANPLTEVSSVSKMKKYLGYDVPVIKGKSVSAYIVIGESKYATHARIIYKDESQFEMEKSKKDISGIYGGKVETKKVIKGVHVVIHTFEKTRYATFTHGDFSYAYETGMNDKRFTQDLTTIISEVVE